MKEVWIVRLEKGFLGVFKEKEEAEKYIRSLSLSGSDYYDLYQTVIVTDME